MGLKTAVQIALRDQDQLQDQADSETAEDLFGDEVVERGRGRPPGSRNRETEAQRKAILASGQSPLAYLASVWRDPGQSTKQRTAAATAALPYLHRKQPIAIEGSGAGLRIAILLPGEEAEAAEFFDADAIDAEFEEIE